MAYTSLPELPPELWGYISSHLSHTDIKSFRLACSQFNNAVFLRLDRVFLSANPLNIEVFCKVASHDKLRHQVTEIIWDEACLTRGPPRTPETHEGHELLSDEDEPDNNREWAEHYSEFYQEELLERHEDEEENGCPNWFKEACEKNIDILKSRKNRDVDRPDHLERREQILAQPPLSECWGHYQHLLNQQKDVIADNSDLQAFLYGVKQFPSLRRVTITPAAHGHLFAPLYRTPMIRAFPKGFNYPIPRGWLYSRINSEPANAYAWNEYPELKERYRGFRIAMRVLANEPNAVSELVLTSHFLPTGINCTIFDEPCQEYDHFATVLKNPGFRRLDITLLVGEESQTGLQACWRSLLNGRLRRALSEAKEIEEFRLHTTFSEALYEKDKYPLIPLESIVPVEKWSNLRHFELAGFVISRDNCISFLKALPKSVRSIEFSMLQFHHAGGWYLMLEEIRQMVSENTLWGGRDATSKPKIAIGFPIRMSKHEPGRGKWIENEVQDFLYNGGENPIEKDYPLQLPLGIGVMKDVFEPNFERPNVDGDLLRELNICKEGYYPPEY
ncbi:hypothetical protein N7532_002605 [Penicillium argentinense]|uniref:F-box domain-containing protein n=1 Tax=Penicillium argentinense TaxID=1131581 RepID=A0A9W9G0N8_9EURO|nr:uncharacterized protein N7532_002605 [Penicillium argentinense]KAJ5109960.1 hypothetical protein N7532_002605 [Penicillium argentinense]